MQERVSVAGPIECEQLLVRVANVPQEAEGPQVLVLLQSTIARLECFLPPYAPPGGPALHSISMVLWALASLNLWPPALTAGLSQALSATLHSKVPKELTAPEVAAVSKSAWALSKFVFSVRHSRSQPQRAPPLPYVAPFDNRSPLCFDLDGAPLFAASSVFDIASSTENYWQRQGSERLEDASSAQTAAHAAHSAIDDAVLYVTSTREGSVRLGDVVHVLIALTRVQGTVTMPVAQWATGPHFVSAIKHARASDDGMALSKIVRGLAPVWGNVSAEFEAAVVQFVTRQTPNLSLSTLRDITIALCARKLDAHQARTLAQAVRRELAVR
jgi:hypothetical protein